MKRTNDILSYLLLLLLLMVTACTDEGREVASINQQMQESDLVELSIRTQVPEMEVGSRAATENISAITAFAFSDESILIKKVDALLSIQTDTTGTLKIKVPKRTRSIHFVAKNNSNDSYNAGKDTLGTTTLQDLLVDKTTTDLHYWGMLTFADENALNASNLSLTLYRNMAKVVLSSKVDTENDYIAGFLNYNGNGTLIPHDANGTLGYQANAVTLPEDKGVASHDSPQQGLGTECFLSEHANDESNRLYAICCIDGKFYKIAFSNSSGVFFPLVRNHLYRIVINQISGGSDSYEVAKDADPINGNVREETLNVTNVSLTSYKGETAQVKVTIPDGVTSLRVTSLPEQFDISAPNDVTVNEGVYNVSGKSFVDFTLTLKDTYIGTTGTPNISFSGSGPSVSATGTGTVTLNGFKDMYEMYVDNSNLNGSSEYSDFFHTRNNTNVSNQSLTTEYVDAGANGSSLAHNHNTAAINMQNESSITFTIADTRYLTLLVARSSNSNAPSINLQKDGQTWTKTSEATTLPDNYNFAKEGDITTSGRLIRYTLEPGTYTLQRGNNDYLLYYMRVTKDKPIMTDIAKPLVTDYELAWSGGAYANTDGKGYLKISDAKHIVDQDNLTHTIALKTGDDNSLKSSLNLSTFTLSNIKLKVATNRYSFDSNNANNTQNHSESNTYTNLNNALTYNAGTYTLSSEIDSPNYKFQSFYDKIQLNSVRYEVINPIMSRLYNSMDSGQQPVDEYTTTDAAWAIGFEMPLVMPTEIGTAIAFDIQGWTKYTSDGDVDVGAGLGVVTLDNDSYQFASQVDVNNNNMKMTHPRPEWIYKIRWANIAGKSITPQITDVNSDVYFSFKGTIGKQVTIPTTLNEQALDISLDFYVDNADSGSGQYTNSNLVFGETNLYLKVTIPAGVAAGTRIELDMETDGTKDWINEWSSRNETLSDGVSYRYNEGITGLVITAQEDKQDYLMCWTFIRSDNNITDNVSITYTLKSDLHTLSGETSANLTITGNNKQIQVSAHDRAADGKITIPLQYGTGTTEEFTVDVVVPDGVTEMKIEAADFNVSWSDGNGNVSNALTYYFPTKQNLTHRFKFTLKEESKSVKTSNIYFSCDDKFVANGTVVVNLTERSADTDGGTTIWSGLAQLEWSVNYLSLSNTIAKGSTVRINFTTTGGAFKLHDGNGQAFKLDNEANNYPNNDSYLGVSSGQTYYEFEVNDITSGTDISNGLQGLKVNGNGLTVTSIVVYDSGASNENVIFQYYFADVNLPTEFNFSGGTCQPINGSLVFTASSQGAEDYSNQITITNISFEENTVYTLTFKVKSDVTDNSDNGLFIGFDNPNDSYSWCGIFTNNGKNVKLVESNEFTEISLTATATATVTNGRLFFNLGHLGACTINIDDLKLVKND